MTEARPVTIFRQAHSNGLAYVGALIGYYYAKEVSREISSIYVAIFNVISFSFLKYSRSFCYYGVGHSNAKTRLNIAYAKEINSFRDQNLWNADHIHLDSNCFCHCNFAPPNKMHQRIGKDSRPYYLAIIIFRPSISQARLLRSNSLSNAIYFYVPTKKGITFFLFAIENFIYCRTIVWPYCFWVLVHVSSLSLFTSRHIAVKGLSLLRTNTDLGLRLDKVDADTVNESGPWNGYGLQSGYITIWAVIHCYRIGKNYYVYAPCILAASFFRPNPFSF